MHYRATRETVRMAALKMDVLDVETLETAAALGTFVLLRRWTTYLDVSGEANGNTARQYRRLILDFLAEVLKPLVEVTEDDVVAYLAAIPAKGAKRGMVMRALKSFYRYAEPRGEVGQNPVGKMKIRKPRAGVAPTLTPDELEAVLHAAEAIDPRARWALQLAYATGARVSSLVEICAADIRMMPEPYLSFRVTKGDRPYGVPLGPTALEAVEHLLALADYRPPKVGTRRDTLIGVGSGTVWKWAKAAGESSGLKVWPHLLRHVYGTRLAEDPQTDIRTWTSLMGHADASQFHRYAAPSDTRTRAAVQAL